MPFWESYARGSTLSARSAWISPACYRTDVAWRSLLRATPPRVIIALGKMPAFIPLDKPAPAGFKTKCRVKSFKAKLGPWSISWPGTFFKTTTLYLPIKFNLELEEGCDESQCCIRQEKRGRVETNHYVAPEHENFVWTADGEIGHLDWWDGQAWYGGNGSWDWNWGGPSIASFSDEPGFHSESDPYPLYYGGAGRRGHFEFRTYVYDAGSGYTLRSIKWGLLIDLSAPNRGRYYFYK